MDQVKFILKNLLVLVTHIILFKKDLTLLMDEKRKEYKFKVTSLELSKFMERFSSRLNKLHPDRQIMSLYMDTHDFYIYNSSHTYDSEKFKLRFRQYSNNETIYKEIKYNTKDGRK